MAQLAWRRGTSAEPSPQLHPPLASVLLYSSLAVAGGWYLDRNFKTFAEILARKMSRFWKTVGSCCLSPSSKYSPKDDSVDEEEFTEEEMLMRLARARQVEGMVQRLEEQRKQKQGKTTTPKGTKSEAKSPPRSKTKGGVLSGLLRGWFGGSPKKKASDKRTTQQNREPMHVQQQNRGIPFDQRPHVSENSRHNQYQEPASTSTRTAQSQRSARESTSSNTKSWQEPSKGTVETRSDHREQTPLLQLEEPSTPTKRSNRNLENNIYNEQQHLLETPSPSSRHRIIRRVSDVNSKVPLCRMCRGKFYPLEDPPIAARKHSYHPSCFKCTYCQGKLKNHPDEDHNEHVADNVTVAEGDENRHPMVVLRCRRCRVDHDRQAKPLVRASVAGEKIVVAPEEVGDLELSFASVASSNNNNDDKAVDGDPCCRCRVCKGRLYPTDESITCRKHTYHMACFKCSQCQGRLKNHPDEDHHEDQDLFGDSKQPVLLLCRRCHLDQEHQSKELVRASVAGEKILVGDEELGDVEAVTENIGHELEDAMHLMIPRCATCGGDFLTYQGEISVVGSLKYHHDCWMLGKPSTPPTTTLLPHQGAKYLPDPLILKLANGGKILATLFLVWKGKEETLKALRKRQSHKTARDPVLARLEMLDQPSVVAAKARLPADLTNLRVDIVGGGDNSISPSMVEPVSIIVPLNQHDNSTSPPAALFCAKLIYYKYNLHHSLYLEIPCNSLSSELDLPSASLTVEICQQK